MTEERPTEPSTEESEAVSPPPSPPPTQVSGAPTQVSGALPPAPEPAVPPPSQPLPPPAPPAIEGFTEPIGAPPSLIEDHPEILVGAAFVGGIILANLIRRRGN